jgi:hypothetical protein
LRGGVRSGELGCGSKGSGRQREPTRGCGGLRDGDSHPVLLLQLGGDGGDCLGRPLLELAGVGVPADALAAVRILVGLVGVVVMLVAALGAAEGSDRKATTTGQR